MCTSLHNAGVEIGENKCGRLVSDIRPFALKIPSLEQQARAREFFRGQHCSRVAANEDIRQNYDMCDVDILLIFYLHS